jgi:DNA polymerase-1
MPRYQNLLIDGLNLMHRAGHNYDLGYWENGNYTPIGMVFGFISMTLSLVRKYGEKQGVRVVVCWDAGYKHRTDLYPNYKISRRTPKSLPEGQETPDKTENQETFREQRDVLRGLLDAMGWEQAKAPGFEADDVMATLAVQAEARGETCGVYTTDGDLQQVVSDRVNVISSGYGKDKIWDPAEVLEKWGFEASRVAELKGLQGDGGDDIPGCPGCGMGWAQKLLGEFGSIEGILAASEKGLLQGTWGGKAWKAKKLTETLRENAELVRISHELAKVVRDCPAVSRDTHFNEPLVRAEFERMAFHSLLEEKNFDLLRSLGRTKQVEAGECEDVLGMFG